MPGREKSKRLSKRSNPLGEDLHMDRFATLKRPLAEDDAMEDDPESNNFLISNRTTQRILKTAKAQLEYISSETDNKELPNDNDDEENVVTTDVGLREMLEGATSTSDYFEFEGGEDNNKEVELEYDDSESNMSEMPSEVPEMGGDLYGIDEEESRILQRFQPKSRIQTRQLADIIMEHIKEKESNMVTQTQSQSAGAPQSNEEDDKERIDPRVSRVYTTIGSVMKRYTSGKVPKAFKILPNIKNWEQLLMLTKPDQWSPHATYQATRIFAANLNECMAQRFYAAVLLPIVHAHIQENHKLHPALYMAVRKALFKPVAFFKGFLLPLATDEECTLKEALIVASVLQRSHLPPVPTAVTLVKISQRPFSGPCAVFLRVLIDKKMALPYQAIDALVSYFYRFIQTHPKEEPLPVLWHQTFLSFTQRYKNDLQVKQLQMLSQVCGVHFHYMITQEIRREIAAAMRGKTVPAQS
ncbi:unnamed protein product [Phytomonas sp. Hart1]|nr:unnamed protein product [Phytomonas sp. Hart1]|eukprot:CCW67957.1 unnamed protein product [Phytomonas sp. isolate Hart1]